MVVGGGEEECESNLNKVVVVAKAVMVQFATIMVPATWSNFVMGQREAKGDVVKAQSQSKAVARS